MFADMQHIKIDAKSFSFHRGGIRLKEIIYFWKVVKLKLGCLEGEGGGSAIPREIRQCGPFKNSARQLFAE